MRIHDPGARLRVWTAHEIPNRAHIDPGGMAAWDQLRTGVCGLITSPVLVVFDQADQTRLVWSYPDLPDWECILAVLAWRGAVWRIQMVYECEWDYDNESLYVLRRPRCMANLRAYLRWVSRQAQVASDVWLHDAYGGGFRGIAERQPNGDWLYIPEGQLDADS